MIYLTAAVILVGALGLLNLLLMLGVLRRLRMAPQTVADGHGDTGGGLRAGRRAESFVVRMLHGERITEEVLIGQGHTLVGFFSPDCGPCRAQAPKFAERAAAWPGGPARVLAVIADDTEQGAEFGEQFEGLARIVVDGLKGPIATALDVTSFPSFGILDDTATVLAEATSVDRLPELATR